MGFNSAIKGLILRDTGNTPALDSCTRILELKRRLLCSFKHQHDTFSVWEWKRQPAGNWCYNLYWISNLRQLTRGCHAARFAWFCVEDKNFLITTSEFTQYYTESWTWRFTEAIKEW